MEKKDNPLDKQTKSPDDFDGFGPFAQTVFEHKYAQTVTETIEGDSGPYTRVRKETWPECARRVAENVLGAIPGGCAPELVDRVSKAILERKFIPGGRYLYASGRAVHGAEVTYV